MNLKIFETLPFFSLYNSKLDSLQKVWLQTNQKISLKASLNLLFLANVLTCAFLFLFSFAIFLDFLFSFGISLICFSLFLLLGFSLPKILADKYATQVESDLHLALRSISLYLSIKWPFEKIISEISKSNYCSSPLFSIAKNSLESGRSIPDSLAHCAKLTNSILFSRAIQSIISVYEKGSGEQSLEYLSDELVQRGIANVRLQSSKTALFGLLFVAVASLFPAFFLILNVAAGPFLGFETTEFTIWFFYIILLPLAIAILLFAMFTISPSLQLSISQKRLDLQLAKKPFYIRPLYESKLIGEIKSLESELPTILLSGASAQKLSIEQMLISGEKSSSTLLSSECSQILSQIKAGGDPKAVLQSWADSTPSLVFERAISLILVGYSTGASMHNAFSSAASDLMSSFNLIRERSALLSMQNYTLIAACSLLVPAILSVSLSFSSQISEISSVGQIEGLSSIDSASLISAARGAIPIYLVLNSILCSLFVTTTLGARHKFLGYALSLSVLSFVVWFLLPFLA